MGTTRHKKGQRVSHYLYRLYDANEQLLYVGISKSAIHRLHEHLTTQPWAEQIVTQKVQRFNSRQELEEAEKAAIKAENPKHNITHNGKRPKGRAVNGTDNTFVDVFNIGECVALGLSSGDCPVGQIEAFDDVWVRLRMKSFLDGSYGYGPNSYRIADIERIVHAPDYLDETDYWTGKKLIDDDHLSEFQTKWQKEHGYKSGMKE